MEQADTAKTLGQNDGQATPSRRAPKQSLKARTILLTSLGFVAGAAAGVLLFTLAPDLGFGIQPESPKPINQNKVSMAVPFELDFPAIFPDISSKKNSKCRAAWDALTSVSCHTNLFNSIYEHGSRMDIQFWDSRYFVPMLCQKDCGRELDAAYEALSSTCSEEADHFILEGYTGSLRKTPLRPTPTRAVLKLLRYWQHTCRASPTGDKMQERFGIIDGMRPDLDGINVLIRISTWPFIKKEKREQGTAYGPGYNYTYDYTVREQRVGPMPGDMSCSWCMFDYLNRTLNSWVEGVIFVPTRNDPVDLPEFIRRIRVVGRRCDPTSTWEETYNESISRYMDAGLLAADWDKDRTPDDLERLVKTGPSQSDYPLSDINADIETLFLESYHSGQGAHRGAIGHTIDCLSEIAGAYSSESCYKHFSREEFYSFLDPKMDHVRSEICNERCDTDPNFYPGSNCDTARASRKASNYISEYQKHRYDRDQYCVILGPEPGASYCARALLNTNRTSWLFDGGYRRTGEEIDQMDTELEDLEAKIARMNTCSGGDMQDPASPSCSNKAPQEQRDIVATSICAQCIWNYMTDSQMLEDAERLSYFPGHEGYVSGIVAFLKRYHATCSSLGADWFGGVPYGDDPRIWRVMETNGDVIRYMVPETNPLGKYWVNERTGEAESTWREGPGAGRVGGNPGTLWHVWKLERGLQAVKEGKQFWEWRKEEDAFRAEVDKELWEPVNEWGLMRYIGPKDGLTDKKVDETSERVKSSENEL
ncbi:unnamed protein product [Clonostachys rosea]|uniref:Uncharacterized protein n=1 Tax=Bionectria ochroleuca TaxID=29856 RepID=A0ABY6TRG1_BIOOC|nr:unnamed protein product [Clonostachys rosea]